ncbi:MAG: NAD(P)H-dependent oxidoreductase [Rhizobacter sp.]|nr:NAD(P)H-dependent oxidoreductase [Chlorobiales bacterium]
MKAIILYDALSEGGTTDRIITSIGETLAAKGVYIEKAKTPPLADYSFLSEFDVIILGSPIYNFTPSPNLTEAFGRSNLLKSMLGKKVALFIICGGPELTAELLYKPQFTARLLRHNVIADKIFGMTEKNNPQSPVRFADEIFEKATAAQS